MFRRIRILGKPQRACVISALLNVGNTGKLRCCANDSCYSSEHLFNEYVCNVFEEEFTCYGTCDVIQNDVRFEDVELIDGNRSAQFESNFWTANLNLNSSVGPNACAGERFRIKVRFRPPGSLGAANLTYVRLSPNNKFEFAPRPSDNVYEEWFGNENPPYVIIHLRKKATGGTSNSVNIYVGGTDYNGDPYQGRGQVRLNCP